MALSRVAPSSHYGVGCDGEKKGSGRAAAVAKKKISLNRINTTLSSSSRGVHHVLRAFAAAAADADADEKTERKVVVVTGGAKGIGAACCRLLAREGWAVVINHREQSLDAATTLASEIRSDGGDARSYQADITVESEIVDMFSAIAEWQVHSSTRTTIDDTACSNYSESRRLEPRTSHHHHQMSDASHETTRTEKTRDRDREETLADLQTLHVPLFKNHFGLKPGAVLSQFHTTIEP